ncbi:Stk1 family PASTA domain-containing Ser/Thr kinase [Nocardioides sp. BP30]|uniref:Stk1 family PASTA domain-containing Ser/Thr kinase n=1 Tax=Nocardioides sp. BP30 TaxID=3036374 RepID=UPI002468860B|nr:Stk1 family PASTA domain-containing Ser/Thr kinase [Nocardioides sp. BP30]WGL52577.1 Stk1 family PASTA domain-containing Ser/Thr kinase [Nocardioides sp. BP30]
MVQPEPTVVGGRYELGELLGRGGMAEVRKGVDTRLGRIVAVKRLRTDLASDTTFQARFRREAQSSASLNHPAIVSVYDTGEEPTAEGISQPYIVMEYVAGRTLRDILREGRKILPERALEITSDVLSALDYSHRAGIIHRDIKPGNVMLTPSGDVKVMDFGIARAVSDAQSTMTQTAAVVGTAQYLSPEQARGETVDSRSDVYSAGCLLYELLTGRPPFVGDSPVAVAYQHVREQAQAPSTHDTALPPAVDAIVMKALAKRLEDRYQSAAAMRNDIERYLAGRPIDAVAPVMAPEPAPPTAATQVVEPTNVVPLSAPEDVDDDRRSRTGLLVLLALLVLAVIAAGAFLLPRLFSGAPDQVQIPNVVGKTQDQARQAIGQAGLEVGDVSYKPDDTAAADTVLRQSPSGGVGAYADPGSEVSLVLSSGKPDVTIQQVVGMSFKDAKSLLEGAGLKVARNDVESDQPQNQVLSANPAVGTTVASGTTVRLDVSKGPKAVPNVVGMTVDKAEQAIRAQGFQPVQADDNSSTQPAGTVTKQSPGAGTTQKQGLEVVIFVSTYTPPPTPSTTPASPCPTPVTLPDGTQTCPPAGVGGALSGTQ